MVGRPGRKSEELSELRATNFRLEINNISGTPGLLTAQGLNFKFLLLSPVSTQIDLRTLIPAYCKYTVPHIFSDMYLRLGLTPMTWSASRQPSGQDRDGNLVNTVKRGD